MNVTKWVSLGDVVKWVDVKYGPEYK